MQLDDSHAQGQQYLAHIQSQVVGLPLRLTTNAANTALDVDLSAYSLPQFRPTAVPAESLHVESSSSLSFRDEADVTGLRFRYFNGTEGAPSRRMFEAIG